VSFKEHPEEAKVAEYPSGATSLLNLDDEGSLVVSVANQIVLPEDSTGAIRVSVENPIVLPEDFTGAIETSSPTIHSLLLELIREVRKSNMYLALLTGEEVQDSDI
jgi:hypothetical protein